MKPTYTLKPRRRTALAIIAVIVVLLTVVIFLRWPRFLADRLPFAQPTAVEFVGDGNGAATNFALSKTEPDSPSARLSAADLLGAGDFEFRMGEGSGMYGYDVIKVGADGRCQYTALERTLTYDPVAKAYRRPGWRRADFTADPATVRDLRQLLADVGYGALPKGYHANVCDGTQWLVKAQAGGRRKGVYCNNHFPAEIIRLSAFVRDRIVAPHKAEIEAGQRIELDPMAQWKEFEDAL